MSQSFKTVVKMSKDFNKSNIVQANDIGDILTALDAENFFCRADKDSKLTLFDFDGVVFPLGGSMEQNADREFIELIKDLKMYSVVGGLTKRRGRAFMPAASCDLSKRTRKCITTFGQNSVEFDLLPGVSEKFAGDSVLVNGVFFVGVQEQMSKGLAIEKIFERLEDKKLPKKVVLVDDSLQNLNSVERRCLDRKIQFLGIHYLAPGKAVKSVEMDKMTYGFQWALRKTIRISGVKEPEWL